LGCERLGKHLWNDMFGGTAWYSFFCLQPRAVLPLGLNFLSCRGACTTRTAQHHSR
jgi:hypothetical protein